jgi:hypothetical protein
MVQKVMVSGGNRFLISSNSGSVTYCTINHYLRSTGNLLPWANHESFNRALEGGEGLHLILPHRNMKKDLLKFSSYQPLARKIHGEG